MGAPSGLRAATIALIVAVGAAPVAAEPPLPLAWQAQEGSAEPGRTPGSFVLATDGSAALFSTALLLATEDVDLPFQLDVTWRRLGPEAGRSLHVQVLGGVVLVKTGVVGLFAYDEAAFAATGWIPVPGLRSHDEHAVRVVQTARQVTLALDGIEVARWPLIAPHPRGRVGVGGKGARGYRSRIFVRSLAVRPAP